MKKFFLKTRSLILVFLTHKIALPLLRIVRRPNAFMYTKDELSQFPANSLGKDLYLFLERRNLPLLKHYARHDLKHVLLNYDTTDEGEACLQSFMMGNGRISFPVIATIIYSFITMPEYWRRMRKAFVKGRNSASFHHWKWNELLYVSTQRLRDRIFNNNC